MKSIVKKLLEDISYREKGEECTFCGCMPIGCKHCEKGYILKQSPLFIGDIIDKFSPYQMAEIELYAPLIVRHWISCDCEDELRTALTMSLQEIIKESGWITENGMVRLKSKYAETLINFIFTLKLRHA